MRTFRTPEACRLVGVTYRQCLHRARSGLVKPSVHDGKGQGDFRIWSEQDLVLLEAVAAFPTDHDSRHNAVERLGGMVNAVRRSGLLRGWACGRGTDWCVVRSPELAVRLAKTVGGPVWILRLGDVLDRIEAEEAVA